MNDAPRATAWGQLIRDAREAAGMSIPEASRAAGISAGQWGNIERGYQTAGKGSKIAAPGNDRTVAHMAATVNLTPEQLERTGREAAARILRTIREQRAAATESAEDRRFDDPALQQIWNDKRLTTDERLGIIALVEGMRASRAGQRPA